MTSSRLFRKIEIMALYKYISRVQESDGNFFENFTALSWRQENKRLRATNEVGAYSQNKHGMQSRQVLVVINFAALLDLYCNIFFFKY